MSGEAIGEPLTAEAGGFATRRGLALADVSLSFGGVRALSNLSVEIPEGRVTGLIGPNGAGKTTVFNVITGFLPPDVGRVTFCGKEITGLRPVEIARLGIVRSFQELRLFPALTVLQNVLMGAVALEAESLVRTLWQGGQWRRDRRRDRERAAAVLDYVGLGGRFDEIAGQLGYGEQKLLSLARLLATGSTYLLLDEPASGLDAPQIDFLVGLIRKLVADGKTVCLVEHNIAVVERASDRLIVLHQGSTVAEGVPSDVLRDETVLRVYLGE